MDIIDKEVYSDKYLAIIKRHTELNIDNPYTFLFEKRSNGKLVVILPFRRNEDGVLEFLIRKESVLVWDPEVMYTESITGGVEEDDPHKTAVMELEEEGGYLVPFDDFIFIGKTRIAKHANTFVYMYAVDLTGKKRVSDFGDGSKSEKMSFSYWSYDIGGVESTIIYKILYKLFEMGIICPCEYFNKRERRYGNFDKINIELE